MRDRQGRIKCMFKEFKNTKFSTKNRFVRAAINDHLGSEDGRVTNAQIELYERLGKNNIGIIITGHYAVSETGRADPFQCGVFSDHQIPGLMKLASAAKSQNSLGIVQISHSGSNFSNVIGQRKVGPSETSDIHGLSIKEIQEIEKQFIDGAYRVKQAGFDGVELHFAHGYLLSEFLDDRVNQREDAYGGSSEKRFLICKEIIEGVRQKCGDSFLIFVKVNANNAAGDEYYTEIFSEYIHYLDQMKVDAIEISGKGFSKHNPKEEEPYFIKAALLAKSVTDIPIILTGGFRNLEMMERSREAGIDFVGLGRSLLCEEDLVTKIQNGEQNVKCLRCNQCFRIYDKKFKRCVFHNVELDQLKANFSSKDC